jgi:chloramphenicol O-acetyltransferase
MAEADNILEWLKQEINNTWKRRDQIKPSFSVAQKPDILNSSQTIAQNQLQRMRPAYVYGVCIIGNRGEKKA